jgi:lysophospholipid acyltransferase (LPLAT)-like uncharacterized protein
VPTTSTATERKESTPARFSLRQRVALFLVGWAGYLAIRLIGPTLRWKLEIEEGGPAGHWIQPAIYVFWHRCVFAGTWWYRHRGGAVMTSSSFDGEYIARIIERFGYRAVRGSSTRGGVRALLRMHAIIEQGGSVAFTIDGPRGPRYLAKPGPVLLARNTGAPIVPFHVGLERAWVLNTWDALMIPKPFSRALLRIGRLIRVPAQADSTALARYHAQMQTALEQVRDFADQQVLVSSARGQA